MKSPRVLLERARADYIIIKGFIRKIYSFCSLYATSTRACAHSGHKGMGRGGQYHCRNYTNAMMTLVDTPHSLRYPGNARTQSYSYTRRRYGNRRMAANSKGPGVSYRGYLRHHRYGEGGGESRGVPRTRC